MKTAAMIKMIEKKIKAEDVFLDFLYDLRKLVIKEGIEAWLSLYLTRGLCTNGLPFTPKNP